MTGLEAESVTFIAQVSSFKFQVQPTFSLLYPLKSAKIYPSLARLPAKTTRGTLNIVQIEMQAGRHILLTVLLATEFLLGAFLLCPRLVDDWRVATAVNNYHRNPTQETKAIMEKESARLRRNLLILDLINTGFLALNTLALYLTVKSIRKQHNQPSQSTAAP